MKNSKNKTKTIGRDSLVNDWQPLFAAVKDVIDWALDIAVKLSRDFDEDIEAIERVRVAFHAWLDGRPSEMDVNDVLLTVATILAQIEIDLGIDSAEMLTPMRSVIGYRGPSSVLRFPGATRDELDTVVIRRLPRRRNASGAFNHLEAA
ncbi:MAG: hypothetical protein JO257_15420 [Deltaproteobacteria bacterium]|nr:hypothetical protein [Deltaproteobacteria bacterium]